MSSLGEQILDTIFWGALGVMSGSAYGGLMGGVGGLIVGGAVGILKVGWTMLDATVVREHRLSAIDAFEMIIEVVTYAFGGVRIGSLILGTLFGVSYGIYLPYLMIRRSRSNRN